MCQPIFPVHGENGLAQCTNTKHRTSNTEHRTSNIQLPMVHCLAWRKGEPFSARSNIQTFRLSLRDARSSLSLRERVRVRGNGANYLLTYGTITETVELHGPSDATGGFPT